MQKQPGAARPVGGERSRVVMTVVEEDVFDHEADGERYDGGPGGYAESFLRFATSCVGPERSGNRSVRHCASPSETATIVCANANTGEVRKESRCFETFRPSK